MSLFRLAIVALNDKMLQILGGLRSSGRGAQGKELGHFSLTD